MEISVILDLMFNMQSKIKIIETGRADGIMSRTKRFYPEYYSEDQINKIFRETRINAGKKYNFNGLHIIKPIQKELAKAKDKNNIFKDYIIVTKEMLNKEDYYDIDFFCDALVLPSTIKDVVLGHPEADCPILICEDRKKGYTSLTHCGAVMINRGTIKHCIDALTDGCNSNKGDIYCYISNSIKKDSYIYDKYPPFATNNTIWKNAITKHNNEYNIDLSLAIREELQRLGIENIKENKEDTATSPKYYSHVKETQGDYSKKGQNFVGIYYI